MGHGLRSGEGLRADRSAPARARRAPGEPDHHAGAGGPAGGYLGGPVRHAARHVGHGRILHGLGDALAVRRALAALALCSVYAACGVAPRDDEAPRDDALDEPSVRPNRAADGGGGMPSTAPPVPSGCIRGGSTPAEVRAAMGEPDSIVGGWWIYGRTQIQFGYGTVQDFIDGG